MRVIPPKLYEAVDTYDRLYVVSDLHIGGKGSFQMFCQGELLATTIRRLATSYPEEGVALVLGGDVVDFLAEEGHTGFEAHGAPEMLRRIMDDKAFADVFKALAEFANAPKRTLIIVLGNHDVELALPNVQRALLDHFVAKAGAASVAAEALRGRVRFATDGTGYHAKVGERLVYFFHGEAADPVNYVDQPGLGAAIEQMRQGQRQHRITKPAMSPGTSFVLDVMNEVKEQATFVDRLKPEMDVAVPLAARAWPTLKNTWTTAWKGLKARARMATASGSKRLLREEDAVQMIGHRVPAPEITPDLLTTDPALSAEYDLLGVWETTNAFFGWSDKALLDGIDAALRVQSTWSHKEEAEDASPVRWSRSQNVRAHVVIAGHTHLRKCIDDHEFPLYFNSGTWASLMKMRAPNDGNAENVPVRSATVSELIEELKKGNTSKFHHTEPTLIEVAKRAPEGVTGRLLEPTLTGGSLTLGEIAVGER